MVSKPTYKSILLTLSFVSHLTLSQTGEGCYNKNQACPQSGQVRINALYHPTTGAFIGGCNCGCDFQAIYNPSSSLYCPSPKEINYNPITQTGDCSCNCPSTAEAQYPSDCQLPHMFNSQSCKCECPGQALTFSHNQPCPLHQIYNYDTCQCECQGIGAPGFECLNQYFEAIPWSTILSDCSCQCPPHAPSISDCQSIGREYNLCECQCPLISCQHPNQILNRESCSCSCPECPLGEILINEFSCECGKLNINNGNSNNGPVQNVQYCCQPMIAGFAPYFGRCWGITNSIECNSEQYGRCKWDVTQCFASKPDCKFRDFVCNNNNECCSTVCKADSLCR
eukprot:68168_1